MPNYFIRVDGQSRTHAQLIDMLANQASPDKIEIIGILNAENPESKQWTFRREGENYHMTAMDMNLGGAGLLRAGVNDGHIVLLADLADSILEAIEYFGPDGVAVNAPPMNQHVPMNMNMHMNNNFNMGFAQPGGRRIRRSLRRRSLRRRSLRRRSQRKPTERRRVFYRRSLRRRTHRRS